ncbi:MAG: VWA domain-containing protein [Bacteroidales bacterium]|nr:VWA domain-containing protein [Bacteroidales bacterium]
MPIAASSAFTPLLFASFVLPAVAGVAALGAVAVPVLIHLLSRQRYQVVPWAAMRFLLAARKSHRRWVDRWLLLAARVLLLLLLLAAMCAVTPWAERLWQDISPGTAEAVSHAPRTHTILVVDSSLSLTTQAGNATRFDKLQNLVEQAVRAANPGDGFTVIELAAGAVAVVPGPSNDAAKVLEEIHKLRPTHGTADFVAGLNLIADTLTQSPRSYPRRQVLFFTDLQRSAWTGLLPTADNPAPDIWNRILPGADFAIVDVAGDEPGNLAVTGLTLADPIPLVDAPTAVTATLRNFGTLDRKNVRVELAVGRDAPPGGRGEPTLFPLEQRVLENLPAGQDVTIAFAIDGSGRFRVPGLHLLRVRIVEPDSLPADDSRMLAVRVREGLPAVLVNGRPAADPLRRASEYLQEALDPGGLHLPGNPARPRTLSLWEFADPALGDLSTVDCVFLCDVPSLTPAEVARLEAHLKRGGGVVIGLGPNAADNLELYNRLLYAEGEGLLPGPLLGVRTVDGADDPGFRLAADDPVYRRPPLAAFKDDNARAGLTGVPFRKYVRLDAPADGKARRVLSFVPAAPRSEPTMEKPEPAVVEWPRHRGRVVVYTSTFNTDWTDWPILPSFLPFAHELLRFAAANPDRHTLDVGQTLEEFLPVTAVGLTASLTNPQGETATLPVVPGDETGVARFPDPRISGLYRFTLAGRWDAMFAVNVPETAPGGGSESDLNRLEPIAFETLGPIQVVSDPGDVRIGGSGETVVVLAPRAHGPTLARWLLSAALLMILLELGLAWRLGPSRAGSSVPHATAEAGGTVGRALVWGVALVPLGCVLFILAVVFHAEVTGDLLGFIPASWRQTLEIWAGVPTAGPGEGTRWRLESRAAYLDNGFSDRWLLSGFALAAGLFALTLYRLERRAAGGLRRLLMPWVLRVTAVLFTLFILLPQLQLAFDREGWPDVAVILDTSASMGTVDDIRDPQARAKAEELARVFNTASVNRLRLAQALLSSAHGNWLHRLLTERKVKVHVYSADAETRLLTMLAEPGDAPTGEEAIRVLQADGPASRLGDSVESVLQSFRGGSLSAIILLTDGVTTQGDDLVTAGQEAARAGVPLYLVGLGDAREPPDLILSDLKADDLVLKGDRMLWEARLTAKGPAPNQTVPVVLYERQGDKLFERARENVRPDPAGKPVPVRLEHTPEEAGEKTFVIDVPVQPDEVEPGNNRLERTILVTESRRMRVLYVEGYPRYEFRFIKALLERETEAVRGNKTIDLNTLLLDASPGYAEQDRSALRAFPTRSELFEYDVVILGDVAPQQVPKATQTFQDLTEFVKTRGGGLLFLAGTQADPHQLFSTPLGELLPVQPSDTPVPEPASDIGVSPEGYRPQLTPFGQTHPLFRLVPDASENARIWAGLRPLIWAATSYRKKRSAEVLAVHPERAAEDASSTRHPLVLQQFIGSGRVIFLGFDETWRWRFRTGEERFNQFWIQAVRVLARNRISRTELRTDKQTAYRRGEPIRLTVRYPDDAPPPPADAAVKVTVHRGPWKQADGTVIGGPAETTTVQLAKVEGSRATYQTLLTRTPEGDYRFQLTTPEPTGTPPRAEAKVLPPPGELERLEMNRPDLLRAAAESRGQFYTLTDADQLIDALPEVMRIPLNQPISPIPLWNQAAGFGLILLLFGVEWLLRRRERLL